MYRGQLYVPHFNSQGDVNYYYTKIRNIYIQWYRNKVVLTNSIHKYWHGWNHSDFYYHEVLMCINDLCEITGVDWWTASLGKLEWGVNLIKQPMEVVDTMLMYKFKKFESMMEQGHRYGSKCEVNGYFLKMYDKEFDSWYQIKLSIEPTVRWEIGGNSKYLTKLFGFSPVLNQVITPDNMRNMANHSLELLRTCIRKDQRNLHKLTATEKKIIAAMENKEIREDLKAHNPETYKNDRKRYLRILKDPEVCIRDFTDVEVENKFNQLLSENPACNILGNKGSILPIAI
ncbi:hypothetical protein [Flavitalea sp.]|nr:hypothetical protein [Flavitalea sp.]